MKIKIITTIGPGSNKPETLEKFKDRGVDFFRINLSHTEEKDIENRIKDVIGYKVPLILDTEGSQVRSGNTEEIFFEEGKIIKLHTQKIKCDSENLFLNPEGVAKKLCEGDLISIDFNSLLLRVLDCAGLEKGWIICKVIISGQIGGKKAVQIDSPTFNLPVYSAKDHKAMELAKKYNINHFTLSFMESAEEVVQFKKMNPEAIVYSKIESKKGLDNFIEIAKASEGILIDRGDLSSQVPLEKIPFAQKLILKKVRELGKEVFVATNTLEQMAFTLKPNKAEVNDVINTILDGATGIALTKETAVGKHPIETVNILSNLINQIYFLENSEKSEFVEKIEDLNYLQKNENPELLIKPHGGLLVNRFNPRFQSFSNKRIEIKEETLMDIEQIALGSFSPLEGFMGKDDFNSVVDRMRLSDGRVWPLPITLSVEKNVSSNLIQGEDISLTFNGEVYGFLHLREIYHIDKKEVVKKIFETEELTHPGVRNFFQNGEYFLGGKITLIRKRNSNYKEYELTPQQTRKIFSERSWSKIVGFHTRNVIHKSHEFIQMEAMKKGLCDGLFVHPIIGKKKQEDFEAEVIIQTYEKMIEDFYPKSKVIFGTFATYSRYAGPREALFTAIVRKNFGCSHFIVGRDHTGVGDFYLPKASHKIFENFNKEEIGIMPILFDRVFYSEIENKHFHESEFISHPEEHKLHISGAQARELLKKGLQPPEWFMRPEISNMILNKLKMGDKVFVE